MVKQTSNRAPLSILVSGERLALPRGQAVLRGIYAVCLERGWSLHRCAWQNVAPAIFDWRPQATILVLDGANRACAEVLKNRIVISAGEDLSSSNWPSVIPDDVEAGRQAAKHLIERGHKSLAAFGYWNDNGGATSYAWAVRRADGFAEVAANYQLAVNRYGLDAKPVAGPTENSRFSAISQWLSGLPKPVGIMAACDDWAGILLSLARRLKFRVPEEIAIVGVDDERSTCETEDPPMSSVVIPWEQIGMASAQLAEEVFAAPARVRMPITIQPAGITVRRSSDILAVDDPDVSAALSIIFAHSSKPLTVTRILRGVPTTQRRLERIFKKMVGRRVVDEIRRVHVEQAKRLLSGSDMPTAMVARRSGFSSASKLAAAFRRETGTTPTAFRRRYRVES